MRSASADRNWQHREGVTSLPTLTPAVPALTGTVTDASTVRPTSPPRPTNTSTVRPQFPTPIDRAGAWTGTTAEGRGTGPGCRKSDRDRPPAGYLCGVNWPSGTMCYTGTRSPSVTCPIVPESPRHSSKRGGNSSEQSLSVHLESKTSILHLYIK